MKRSMTRGLVLVALAIPGALHAQAGHVWLEARGGWLFPTSDLGRTDVIDNWGYGVFEQVDDGAVFGVGLGVGLGSRWAIRASFDHALDVPVHGQWQCAPFVACPAVLLPLEGDLTRWSVVVDALVRPALEILVTPVFSAGVGVRRNALSWGEPAADVTLPAFSFSDTDVLVRFGVGAERALGNATLFGEFQMTTARFGGGAFESIEGSIAADRDVSIEMGLVAGVRIRLHEIAIANRRS